MGASCLRRFNDSFILCRMLFNYNEYNGRVIQRLLAAPANQGENIH